MKYPFIFLSGLRWLDFVNTRPALGGERVDLLATPGDVEDWIRAAGRGDGPGRPPAVGGASRNARRPAVNRGSAALYEDAVRVRERLDDLARRASAGRALPRDVQAWIDRRLESVPGSLRLIPGRKVKTPAIEFITDPKSPGAALFPVIRSVAEWLAAGGRPVIRACGNPACVLYFADTTKSGTRRWCNETSCGNRSRVAAFRKRRRAAD